MFPLRDSIRVGKRRQVPNQGGERSHLIDDFDDVPGAKLSFVELLNVLVTETDCTNSRNTTDPIHGRFILKIYISKTYCWTADSFLLRCTASVSSDYGDEIPHGRLRVQA